MNMKKFWKRLQAILSDNRSGFFSAEDYDQWRKVTSRRLKKEKSRSRKATKRGRTPRDMVFSGRISERWLV